MFYCVIVFGLLTSRLEWLTAGALAAALTYSGSAAIHGCLLVWRGPAYGELDLYPLLAILSTSCLITVPLINWSSTLRRLGSRDGDNSGARTIIIYWGLLVLVGLITVVVTFWNQTYYGSNFSTLNPLTCNPPDAQMNYTAGQNLSSHGFSVNTEWIHQNRCADPCQSSSFLWSPTIFRSYSQLQLLTATEVVLLNSYMAVPSTFSGFFTFFYAYGLFGTIVGSFVFLEGIWALCFGRKTPRQARDIVYSFIVNLSNDAVAISSQIDGTAGRSIQRRAAKYIAIFAYFWAVIATVLSALLFLANVIIMELVLAYLPQSESAINVGAWSPWTNTGLVVFAAFVGKFNDRLVWWCCMSVRQPLSIFGHRMNGVKQSKHTEEDYEAAPQPVLEKSDAIRRARQDHWTLPSRVLYLFSFASEKLLCMLHSLRGEWLLLKAFWKDPDSAMNISPVMHSNS